MITALPDVQSLDLKPENGDFIILACDGIWNSLCSQKAVDFISNRIHCPEIKLSSICEEVIITLHLIIYNTFINTINSPV